MIEKTPSHRRKTAHLWGIDAEAKAAAYLRERKYRIVAERLRTPGGEIDLLALQEKDTLAIVEVKARNTLDEGLFSMTPAKQKRLVRAAQGLLTLLETGQIPLEKFTGLRKISDLNIRFDLIVITPDKPPYHLINAWQIE